MKLPAKKQQNLLVAIAFSATATAKTNTIDNQRVKPKNIGNNRQKTGKTRNDPKTKYETQTTAPTQPTS